MGTCFVMITGNMLDERFWSKVDKTSTCWNWVSNISYNGYGTFYYNKKLQYSHRLSYESIKGKIPKGLQIDHLCRNRKCVNPDHLEVVTQKENCRRGLAGINQTTKTHCPQGHEYSEENTYIAPRKNRSPDRHCRICTQIRKHQFNQRKKMELVLL